MIITYDPIDNFPTIHLSKVDLDELAQTNYIYSYDDGIALVMLDGLIHVLAEKQGDYELKISKDGDI